MFFRRRCLPVFAIVAVIEIVGAGVLTGFTPPARGATTGWTIISGAPPDTQANQVLLNTTCANAWDCWSVGAIVPEVPNAKPLALAEHWNGSSWSNVAGVQPQGQQASVLYDVSCVTASDCWGVGGQQTLLAGNDPKVLMEHWDGAHWSVAQSPPTGGLLFSVDCPGADDCWAVGATVDPVSGNVVGSLAFYWDGSSWTQITLPASGQSNEQVSSVSCTGSSDCWAVGTASPNSIWSDLIPNLLYKSQGAEPWLLHWDGSTWSGSTAPDPQSPTGASLSGVTCVTSSECWAVGSTMDANGHFSEPLVEGWDGATWSIAPTPLADLGVLANVTCLSDSACWAVGASSVVQQNGSSPQALIESWDGSSWTVDPSPDVTAISDLYGVACSLGAQCFASGLAETNPNTSTLQPLLEETTLPSMGQGFEATATDGGVFAYGDAGFYGSMGGHHLDAPIVGMATTSDGGGYWLVAADGGVFAFGDAAFLGSMGGHHLDASIVSMAATSDGGGYWLVAADGGVFAFGDAGFFGSMAGALGGNRAVAIAGTPDGGGYWLLGRDGGVFAFGDASFFGSVPGQGLVADAPLTGISATPDGHGYWLVAANGSVYDYGDANWLGGLGQLRLNAPIAGVTQAG
ncbi:MAG: hypothetical protein WBG41_17040 [Acidimicrobiales bacterium]